MSNSTFRIIDVYTCDLWEYNDIKWQSITKNMPFTAVMKMNKCLIRWIHVHMNFLKDCRNEQVLTIESVVQQTWHAFGTFLTKRNIFADCLSYQGCKQKDTLWLQSHEFQTALLKGLTTSSIMQQDHNVTALWHRSFMWFALWHQRWPPVYFP